MDIKDVILAPGNGAFFYDDQAAIRAGAGHDGFSYVGSPVTRGFTSIRIPASSLSIGLILDDDTIAWGDMMSVQYSGAAGRDPLFDPDTIASVVRSIIIPRLLDCDASSFLTACDGVLKYHEGKRLPLAIEYGVSQALLAAAAHCRRSTMAEVVCAEFGLPLPEKKVPVFGQSGDAREVNVDKMVLKSVDVLPHGLINSREKFGREGETFREFVRWVASRIRQIGAPNYQPTLHFDVYGWVGLEFGLDPARIAAFIGSVCDDAPEFTVNFECPADFGSTEAQVEGYAAILAEMDKIGSRGRVVVDERCNTLADIKLFAEAQAAHLVQIKMPDVGSIADTAKAILLCKKNGVGSYVGGSCAETDLSARASVNIAVATQADMMLAKPGMGVDEGFSIVCNEQSRLLAVLAHKAIATGSNALCAASK